MAGKQVQRRKGTTADMAVFTGALAEITVDTTKKTAVVHDGATPGGFPLARASDVAATNANVTTAQNAANAAQATANTAVANAATAQTQANLGVTKANTAQAEVDALELVVAANAAGTVSQSSSTGAAHLPAGTTAQRPVAPVEGDFRFSSQLNRWEGYTNAGGWGQVGGDSLPLFFTTWWPNRAAIPAGFTVADGQLLSRATFPDAAAGIIAGNVPNTSDSTWLGTVAQRGKYTLGDGTSNFRVPDYNGKYTGSLGAAFLRGDGAMSAGTNGELQLSDNLSHIHSINDPGHFHSMGVTTGTAYTAGGVFSAIAGATSTGVKATGITINAAGGSESRPLNVTGCYVIKLFGAVINPGSVNAAQLASDLANLTATSYSRATILGSVSQTAGVPTGALMEAGSNANGRYIKYADGTLICTKRVALNRAVNVAIGSSFMPSSPDAATAYAVPFSAVPDETVTVAGVSYSLWWAGFLDNSTTMTQSGLAMSAVTRAASNYSITFTAIGRWF